MPGFLSNVKNLNFQADVDNFSGDMVFHKDVDNV